MELKLHPKQRLLLDSIGPAREILYGGAAGGAKSHALRAIAIIVAMEVPKAQIYLFRRLSKDLHSTHMVGPGGFPALLKPLTDAKLCHINLSRNQINFKNDAIIHLGHIQYKSNLENYLSSEIHVALWDEATTFTQEMIGFMRSRVRLGGLEVPEKWQKRLPFIVYASNPRGASHHYFRRHFVMARKAYTIFQAPKSDGGMSRLFIPALISDNPTLTENDPDYADRLRGMGDPSMVEAYLSGDWSTVEGAALPQFSYEVHVKPRLVKVGNHAVQRAYDYGYSSPYSVLWYVRIESNEEVKFEGQDPISLPRGSIIVIKELYGADSEERGISEDVTKTAMKIRMRELEWFGRRSVLPGPADNQIFSKEHGESIASKMALRGVEFTASDKTPGSRVRGLAVLRSMLTAATRWPYEEPILLITNECPKLIEHLGLLQLEDTTSGEDVATDGQPDHDFDTLRYIALAVQNRASLAQVVGY